MLEESYLPVAPGVVRGDFVDGMYSSGESDPTDKRAFVIAAGGEL